MPSLIVIDHKAVSLTVTEISQIKIFEGQFDLDLISQGYPKLATSLSLHVGYDVIAFVVLEEFS